MSDIMKRKCQKNDMLKFMMLESNTFLILQTLTNGRQYRKTSRATRERA